MPVLDDPQALVEEWKAVVPRLGFDIPLRLTAKRSAQRKLVGRARDISNSGMVIFAGFDLAIHERITLELTTPECEPIQARAVVRNRDGYIYAIEFLNATDEDRANIVHLQDALSMFAWYWAGSKW